MVEFSMPIENNEWYVEVEEADEVLSVTATDMEGYQTQFELNMDTWGYIMYAIIERLRNTRRVLG